MGWASGSTLLDEVAKVVMPPIPREVRERTARRLIEAFRDEDCDTIDECVQSDIKRAWKKMVKELYGDEE